MAGKFAGQQLVLQLDRDHLVVGSVVRPRQKVQLAHSYKPEGVPDGGMGWVRRVGDLSRDAVPR